MQVRTGIERPNLLTEAVLNRPMVKLVSDEFPSVKPCYGTKAMHQVRIRLGSQVMMPGKIMQSASPRIISKTNGVADL